MIDSFQFNVSPRSKQTQMRPMGSSSYALIALSVSLLVGCAGKVDYMRPYTQATPTSNVRSIERARDSVWNLSVPELGKQFFVINNLDKASGLMNISYTGDPERYIDCGRITSNVKNLRGDRTYDFPGSKAQQSYEVMPSGNLYFIDRRMKLEGRVNLIFEEVGSNATRVTANTRYVVTRTLVTRNAANNVPHTTTETITFNSGSAGAPFPGNSQGQHSECVPTGALEREILSAVK